MSVRHPAVAGTFYPEQPAVLRQLVSDLVAPLGDHPVPKALIVPHAGYIYSGSVAGHVFATLKPVADIIRRVVLFGPSHRVPLWDLALPDADRFETPLGSVPLDSDAFALIRDLPQVAIEPDAHTWEHSLEVQLPFLQVCLTDFALVPLVVGEAAPEAVAQVIDRLWGGPETLLVFSSDLSHYLPYSQACQRDLATCQRIERLQGPLEGDQACGCMALNGLLALGEQRSLRIECLEYKNSGDTAGDKSRVVGYGGYLVYETDT